MKTLGKASLFVIAVVAITFSILPEAHAQRYGSYSRTKVNLAGDMSFGIGLSTVSSDQKDMNRLIDAASNSANASTKDLGSAYDIWANFVYRMTASNYALVFRPSYFTQKTDGTGTGGNFDYELTGFTIMPMFRVYPLENSFIRFYMQGGLGYGSLEGSITAGAFNQDFKGSAFGAIGGIGAEFCFTDTHCLTVEGNLRYLPIERNVSTGGTCTAANDIPGLSQCGASGTELERNGKDLSTTMSGVQGLVGYTMYF